MCRYVSKSQEEVVYLLLVLLMLGASIGFVLLFHYAHGRPRHEVEHVCIPGVFLFLGGLLVGLIRLGSVIEFDFQGDEGMHQRMEKKSLGRGRCIA